MTSYTSTLASIAAVSGTWVDEAGGAMAIGDITGGVDANYVKKSGSAGSTVRVTATENATMRTAITNGTEKLRRVRMTTRAQRPLSGGHFGCYIALYERTSAAYFTAYNITSLLTPVATWTDVTGPWYTTTPSGTSLLEHGASATTIDCDFINSAISPGEFAYWTAATIEMETCSVPTTVVSGPASPVTTTSAPASTWTFVDVDAGAQTAAEVMIYTAAQYGAGGFVAGTSTAEHSSGTLSGVLTYTPTSGLTNNTTYKTYVRVCKDVDGQTVWSNWTASSAWSIAVPAPSPPELAAAWTSGTQSVAITGIGHANLLTANQGSVETDTTGWVTSGSNCTASRQTTAGFYASGAASLRLSSTAGGDMSTTTLTGTSGVSVTTGKVYTALCVSKSAASARSVHIDIVWYDSGGSVISTSTGSSTTNATGSHTLHYCTATAPALATYAAIKPYVISTGAGSELHYFDAFVLCPGTVAPASSAAYLLEGFMTGGHTAHTMQVQYSADTGTTWADVTSGDAVNVYTNTQALALTDYEAARAITAYYRARSVATVGGFNVTSSWSTSATVATSNDGTWWLKAVSDPTLNTGSINVQGPLSTTTEADVGIFRPLDGDTSIVVSGAVWGEDGEYKIHCSTEALWTGGIRDLYRHAGTLLVQDPMNRQKYVRWVGRSLSESYAAGNNRRDIVLKYVEVAG